MIKSEMNQALVELRGLVNEQAEDEGIWFRAMYASEAYLQRALRDLHDAVERLTVDNPQ